METIGGVIGQLNYPTRFKTTFCFFAAEPWWGKCSETAKSGRDSPPSRAHGGDGLRGVRVSGGLRVRFGLDQCGAGFGDGRDRVRVADDPVDGLRAARLVCRDGDRLDLRVECAPPRSALADR